MSNGHRQKDNSAASTEPLQPPNSNEELIGPSVQIEGVRTNNEEGLAALSPYSASRATIRSLTLPTIPNLDIPPSPPGSPPLGMDKRFSHFLGLKVQGVHFNEKLARSSALKNPSLLKKLMDSAGIEESNQYQSTLSENLWNPAGLPIWAYKEELAKSQQEMTKKHEEERTHTQRENVEFVSATTLGHSNRIAAPSRDNSAKTLRVSATERVMAGLDRDRVRSSNITLTSRLRNDRKPPKVTSGVSRHSGRSRSRSPVRRKRSRSR